MIYQCYECRKLFDEDYGAMVMDKDFSAFPVPVILDILVFKCKNCMGEKGRETIDKIQKDKRK